MTTKYTRVMMLENKSQPTLERQINDELDGLEQTGSTVVDIKYSTTREGLRRN